MITLLLILSLALTPTIHARIRGGSAWTRVGPHNIFNAYNDGGKGKLPMGEGGTLAGASSLATSPNIIYAGGQNNGVSSGIIKTIDGGKTWTRQSNGIWDTRILGVWVHPDDTTGNHVFTGTHSGIYESKDGAESWTLREETSKWGNVMSFREGLIQGKQYILANCGNGGIATMPRGGGTWQYIKAPGPIAPNGHLSVVINPDQTTEVLTCIGNWGGGKLYYAKVNTPTSATWVGPLGSSTETYDCANAAVDPNDRDHFLFSKAGEYRAWESNDGGKTAHEITNHDTGVYFVMIDQKGWLYTATQAGAFVSMDKGVKWSAYHVFMERPDGSIVDRVPHDYQMIEPAFRGNGIAFPSDQGLHIVNGSELNLTSAVGDMKNNMILSALIAPNKEGSRNLVCNIWDWDVVASWNDGATWTGWKETEHSPSQCGEGGGGQGMGKSGKLIMFHRNYWWFSEDGGHNFKIGSLPGGAGAFDYVRQPGSRTEPVGTVFAILDAPAPKELMNNALPLSISNTPSLSKNGTNYSPADDDEGEEPDDPADEIKREMDPWLSRYTYNSGLLPESVTGNIKYLMTSEDFGKNWTWTPLPAKMQAGQITVDPTSANSLYALTENCLAHSTDKGVTWSACKNAPGLTGRFSKLLVKDSSTMFMIRTGAVPLRTKDGGATWKELSACAPLFQYGATMAGTLSWTGKTFVLTGTDISAIGRKKYGTYVWKSTDDGETWTDETGDLVTISPGPGVWYENDFYFVTRGEGLTVKRNFETY